ncbi:hypothetical protein NLJ89_g7784 [Agrocybe chaxingu]|uniref:Nucleotide exchange factor Fes1 domain-containing protein n=1 Tax=Agrocybe chaxingu TaxID=84603 RepID=A0A9W8JVP8_9AGAR|nr:hypothetical protein NLJ89_g7784 [Agrocybe chaxingu]
MQSILRWSLENSTPLDSAARSQPPEGRSPIDPEIIDMILGKPDAIKMTESMAIAVDPSKSEDERMTALDDLEMLIEHIDNANDLQKLGLWEPLQSLLTAESSTPEIRTQALWAIGTAVQNNPLAQDVYLSYSPLPVLLSFLGPSSSSGASGRAKAIYTLSGLLKHHAPAVEALGKPGVNGWPRLRGALQDSSISVRRKTVFLLSTLLMPTSPSTSQSTNFPAPPNALRITDDPNSEAPNILTPDDRPAAPSDPVYANSHAAHLQDPSRTATSPITLIAFKEHGILDAVVSSLITPLPHGDDGENTDADVDYEEKAVRLLHTYAVTCNGELSKEQKKNLKSWIQAEKTKVGENELLEKWSLGREEYAALVEKL